MSDAQIWGLVVYLRELQARDYRDNGGAPQADPKGVFSSTHHRYRIDTLIAKGLDTPWAVDFLPSGEMLVTERPGTLRVFKDGSLSAPATGLPEVRNRGQGGLMDIAVHPDFAKTGHIFLAYSDLGADRRGSGMTKIIRGTLNRPDPAKPWVWSNQKTIFQAKQEHYLNTDLHFGCRIVFDPIDPSILFFAIGERGMSQHAQDLSRPNGKVHRVSITGDIPPGNPFANRDDAYPSIWSFGHRNPQGLVFDLEGNLWDTEHGPRGGDEVNLILKGRNYGWPTVSFGIDYSGAPFRTPFANPDKAVTGGPIVMPAYRWMPSIGACGLDVVKGPAFPKWQGDLVAGGLSGSNVDRLRFKVGPDGSTELIECEELLFGKGRVRDVVTGPEGAIYVVLNGPDRVIRLVPAGGS
jgi:glucose/arabinose dehydrogenase